jgi:nitrogen fixation/metabolism regulation signal transduction histidine kinase
MGLVRIIKERIELKYMLFVVALLVAGIVWSTVLSFKVRENLYSTAQENLDATATIVALDITRAMHESVEKKAALSREIVESLRTVKGIEQAMILNANGREAFKKDSGIMDAEIIRKMAMDMKPKTEMDETEKFITYWKPLENTSYCMECHSLEGALLGTVKVTASLEEIYGTSTQFILWTTIISIVGIFLGTFLFWIILRKLIIQPLHTIEEGAQSLSDGDLSLTLDIKKEDEIGRVSRAINLSVKSLSGILQ